jgi:hypothetical protein
MNNTCGRTVHRGVMDIGLTAFCFMVLCGSLIFLASIELTDVN